MLNRIKLAIFLLIIPGIYHSCEKPKQHPLPNVEVDIILNLNNAENTALKIVGGSKIIEGGINGIIIYRTDLYNFKAFEITCPHNPDENCKVETNGGYATCPCCESVYFLYDGSVSQGSVSAWPLKSYQTDYSEPSLWIHN